MNTDPTLKPDIAALEDAQREPGQEDHDAMRTLADWHEDDGPVVWWRLPVDEPAWIGTPLDEDWPGYHTHWTPHPAAPKETEPREQGRARLTADVVEQRLLTWRQRFVNRSGDQLALDDFMDRQSIDDLVDFVCDEDTPPGVLDALHERVQDDRDAMLCRNTQLAGENLDLAILVRRLALALRTAQPDHPEISDAALDYLRRIGHVGGVLR